MNQGQRYLRNTLVAMCAAVPLFFGLNRLSAAMAHNGAPQWLLKATSLGLASPARSGSKAQYLAGLALRDFTRVHVHGRFAVEIIGASQYKLRFTAADGRELPLEVRQDGDELWLTGHTRSSATTTAVLRIETPALLEVDARKLTGLTLRGLRSPELMVHLHDVLEASLLQNSVAQWRLYSDIAAELQVDNVTLAAGKLLTSGEIAIRYAE